MAEPYEIALKRAEKELADCEARISELDHKRAQLRQTIVVLKSQLGIKVEKEGSMTDAILLVLQAWPGAATVQEIVERLTIMGYEPQTPSVATILSRLTRTRRIASWFGDEGEIGYEWNEELTKVQRETARRELAGKAPKRK